MSDYRRYPPKSGCSPAVGVTLALGTFIILILWWLLTWAN